MEHLASAQFWFESFQNWQSEFLSTAVIVVLSIFLRFRGSSESKPVALRIPKQAADRICNQPVRPKLARKRPSTL
ncbi:hypothetical protein AGROH133_14481 (plasmid) [Agrobacterium tumefaciens]|nr:hypothetical protein AGROH133_14481 [Agrobacterium tumefaciens]